MKTKIDLKKIENICKANDISYLALFGSYALGKQRENSDVDLLVDFKKIKSLLEKGKVIVQFQDLFKKEVDLVSRKNLKPSLKPFIEKLLITLYEKK
jgi:uncharacterized protein